MTCTVSENIRERLVEADLHGLIEARDLVDGFFQILKAANRCGYNKIIYTTYNDTDLSQLTLRNMNDQMLVLMEKTRDLWPAGIRSAWVVPKALNRGVIELWKVTQEKLGSFDLEIFLDRHSAIRWLGESAPDSKEVWGRGDLPASLTGSIR